MASVQFRGLADAVEAFENTGCAAWSLWQGRQFITKGIGEDELNAFLTLLAKNELSSAVYTIAYYEGVEDKTKINNKTPIDGSFNFYLSDNAVEIKGMYDKRVTLGNDVQSRIAGLENKLDKVLQQFEDDGDGIDEPENKLGIIGEILGHPQLGPLCQQILMKLATSAISPGQPAEPAKLAKVAGFGNAADNDTVLENALSRLLKIDSKLPQRLQKLAVLAEQDLNTYNYITGMLDQMNVG